MNKPRPTNEAPSFVHSGLSPLSCRDITVTFILSLFNSRAYQSQIVIQFYIFTKGKIESNEMSGHGGKCKRGNVRRFICKYTQHSNASWHLRASLLLYLAKEDYLQGIRMDFFLILHFPFAAGKSQRARALGRRNSSPCLDFFICQNMKSFIFPEGEIL